MSSSSLRPATPGNQGKMNRIDLRDGPVGQAVSLSYIDHATMA